MIIYRITNKINGKVYIGQTRKTLEYRKQQHIKCAKDGTDRHLYNAMRKYGVENFIFEQIDMASSPEELNYLESKYILEYDSVRKGYNMGYGGDNNVMDSEVVKIKHDDVMRSDEVRKKISHSMSEYRKRVPFSEEHRAKISKAMTGNHNFGNIKLTPEHINALRESHFKKLHCIDECGNVMAQFDTVSDAAKWWEVNGYGKSKYLRTICGAIKRSNTQDRYIKGLKWIYE